MPSLFELIDSVDARRRNSKTDIKQTIRSNLQNPKKCIDALSILIENMSLGKNCSKYFIDVVKVVYNGGLEFDVLLGIYLASYSAQNSAATVLTLQKYHDMCSNFNDPWSTSIAIRNYSSLHIEFSNDTFFDIIENAILLCSDICIIKSCSFALLKVAFKEKNLRSKSINLLVKLIEKASDELSLGTPLYAFSLLCTNEDLHHIHKSYKKIVKHLPKIEHIYISQILSMLSDYCHQFFSDPNILYGDFTGDYSNVSKEYTDLFDLYNKCMIFLRSYHTTLVLAATKFFLETGIFFYSKECIKPLIRIITAGFEFRNEAISTIISNISQKPKYFIKYCHIFIYLKVIPLQSRVIIANLLLFNETIDMILEFLQFELGESHNTVEYKHIFKLLFKIIEFTESRTKLVDAMGIFFESSNPIIVESIMTSIKEFLPTCSPRIKENILVKLIENYLSLIGSKSVVQLNLLQSFIDNSESISLDKLIEISEQLLSNFKKSENCVKYLIINLSLKIYISSEDNSENEKLIIARIKTLVDISLYISNENSKIQASVIKYILDHSSSPKIDIKRFFFNDDETMISKRKNYDKNDGTKDYTGFLENNKWSTKCIDPKTRDHEVYIEKTANLDKIESLDVKELEVYNSVPPRSGLLDITDYSS